MLAQALKAKGKELDPAMRERIEKFAEDITRKNNLMGIGPDDPGKSGHA